LYVPFVKMCSSFTHKTFFCVDIDKYNVVGLYIPVGSNRFQLSIISTGKMVACKMESNIQKACS
jgi:hypothetical protein